MTKIFIATIPSEGNVAFDIDLATLHAAEQALEEERRQRQLEEEQTKSATETPETRRIVGLIGGWASGWLA